LGWKIHVSETPSDTVDLAAQPDTRDSARAADLLRHEADALTIEYRVALATFDDALLPPPLQAVARELDAGARELRGALREQPDAPYLLERLRHTYDQRLKLTRRAALG
jgi:hypothetical protein